MKSETLEEVKWAIRNKYAFPGGYQVNLVMEDGELLCIDCAKDNFKLIAYATKNPGYPDSWRAIGGDVHWEGESEYCAHCNKELPSEYGNPEEEGN